MVAPRRRLRSLAAGLLYVGAVVLFLEAASRAALSSDSLFQRIAAEDDSSHRLRWIQSRAKKTDVAYFFDEYHPTRGWALKRGLRDLPVFGTKRLSSSSKGIRGTTEPAPEKPPGRTRIVVLGDSFTFGEEVGDDETYASQLQRLAPDTEVLNLGVHGYGHDQMLLYLREEGLAYRPDVVLLGFTHIDMPRNLLSFRDYAKPRFDLEGSRLQLRGVPVPEPNKVIAAELTRSKLIDLLSMLRARWQERSGERERRSAQVTTAILDEIAGVAATGGATPVFAYLPVREELEPVDLRPTARQQFFLDYCSTHRVTCLDLRPAFRGHSKEHSTQGTSGHWTPAQHALAAQALRDGLSQAGLLPRRPEP